MAAKLKLASNLCPFSRLSDRFVPAGYTEGYDLPRQLDMLAQIEGIDGMALGWPCHFGDAAAVKRALDDTRPRHLHHRYRHLYRRQVQTGLALQPRPEDSPRGHRPHQGDDRRGRRIRLARHQSLAWPRRLSSTSSRAIMPTPGNGSKKGFRRSPSTTRGPHQHRAEVQGAPCPRVPGQYRHGADAGQQDQQAARRHHPGFRP